ncbi:MAG: ABC transporter permease [Clostridium sp.]
MNRADIKDRAEENFLLNKKRSKRTVRAMAIGIFCITTMISITIGANNIINDFLSNKEDLLNVEVNGKIVSGGNLGILPIAQMTRIARLQNSDIDYIREEYSDLFSAEYLNSLIDQTLFTSTMDKYTFRQNTTAVSLESLENKDVKYYLGGNVKDVNGAVVSRSFIEKALLTDDWNNNKTNNFKKVDDIIGKTVYMQYVNVNWIDGEKEIIKKDIPVRIDGVFEDNTKYFGETRIIADPGYAMTDFDDCFMYIPIERIYDIERMMKSSMLSEIKVSLKAKDLESMELLINKLKDDKYMFKSKGDTYLTIKYITFTLKLLLGIIGVLILVTSTIGIVNVFLMSIIERRKEIDIYRACGASKKVIKKIFTYEAYIIGFKGGTRGVTCSVLVTFLLNYLSKDIINIQTMTNTKIASYNPLIFILGFFISIGITYIAVIPTLNKIQHK